MSEQHASSPKSGLSFSLPPLEMHVSFTMLIHAQWLRADSVTAAVSLNISLLSKSFSSFSSFSFLVLSIYADHFHLSVSLDSSLSIFSLGGSYNPALIGGGGGSWLELDTSRGGVYWTHNNGAISIENIRKETLRKASGWRLPERSLDWRAGVSPEKGFVMDDLSTFQHKHTHTHTKSKARDREAAQHSSFLLYFSISLLFSVSLSLFNIYSNSKSIYYIYTCILFKKEVQTSEWQL